MPTPGAVPATLGPATPGPGPLGGPVTVPTRTPVVVTLGALDPSPGVRVATLHAAEPPAPVAGEGGPGPGRRVVPRSAEVVTTSPFRSTPDAEEVEATRLRPARGRVPEVAGRTLTVELTDGRRVTFSGTALVGRNPAPRPGEVPGCLVAVADPGRSVSKTHLAVGVDASGAWVRDRASTNGTVVTLADGQQVLCGAEQQVRLPAGATVAFGDYGLSVVPDDEA